MKKIVCLFIFSTALVCTGCSNIFSVPEVNRTAYMLNVPPPQHTEKNRQTNKTLLIEYSTISSAFSGRYFVYRKSQLIFDNDFYHYFFTAPSAQITEITARWMQHSGLFKQVLTPLDTTEASYILLTHVNALYANYIDPHKPTAFLDIDTKLVKNTHNGAALVFEKDYQANLPLATKGGTALVKAWSEDLNQILVNLQKDISTHLKT